VKSSQRQTAAAVGFFALCVMSAPVLAQRSGQPEQRGGPIKADGSTPWILVTTFQSADRKLGVEAADEVRRRFQGEWSMKDLAVVTKGNIENTLTASGYRPDSALNASDLMELSKQLHGDYVLDGRATRTGTGPVRLESRVMIRLGQTNLAQPLPPSEGKDPGDAAKGVEKSFSEMFKSIPAYKKCVDALRAAKNDEAITNARASIALYQNSTYARICMLNAYVNKKESPDSIIAVANALRAIDPTNMYALSQLALSYNEKGDKDKAIEMNMQIYRLDPSNREVVDGLIRLLAVGSPERALTLLDTLMMNNPGDVGMVRTKWQLQLLAKRFKEAIATGEEMAKLDTAAANLDYFNRQIGAAQNDSNTAKIIELASKAGQKFPTDVSFQNLLALTYRKTGQLQQAFQAARRANGIDPKNANGWLIAIVLANELKMLDTISALAPKAIAAGADKNAIGQTLAATISPLVQQANELKTREAWQAVLTTAQSVDAIAPSAASKLYIGVASFSIAQDAFAGLNDLAKKVQDSKTKAADVKEASAKGCEELKIIEDNYANAQIALPQGAQASKETAAQIMTGIGEYSKYIPQFKGIFKCK